MYQAYVLLGINVSNIGLKITNALTIEVLCFSALSATGALFNEFDISDMAE